MKHVVSSESMLGPIPSKTCASLCGGPDVPCVAYDPRECAKGFVADDRPAQGWEQQP